MLKNTIIYVSLLMLFFIGVSKVFAINEKDIFNSAFSNIQLVKEDSLKDIRGGYMGVYFQVVFTGFWDNLGHNISIMDGENNSNFSTDQTISFSSDTNMKSMALIGGFNGANGVFQINQVPGSNNMIENNLVINITVITDQQVINSLNKILKIMPLNF